MTDRLHIPTRARRLSLASGLAVRSRRLLWRGRAESWDEEGSRALTKVFAAVLNACQTKPDTVAVDLGCGSGQLTLPLAERCATVLGVDVSPGMIALLEEKAGVAGLSNLQLKVRPIEALDLDAGTMDLVVTNYALHHLRDADKKAVLARALGWLRPGGQLVIGDMMFGRGSSPRDRQVIGAKVREMARRGPAGWWRILKNVWRFTLRTSEKPISAADWEDLVAQAGFDQIHVQLVVQEACVLSAIKPPVS
ncbi:MAG: class I SAM-dependent methyltransferase [Actinomycetota bacterium]|nr:class I SAM-dependent methyltransferase [Actinomycetota bacterium]